jgi:tetratricopeptide (TPR) repeat protein
VSSYAAVHRRIASGPDRASRAAQALHKSVTSDAFLVCAVALALTLLAFVTKGGVELGGNTWTEIVLILLGAALATTVLLAGGRGSYWGAAPVALFVALAVLTALSIAWSVQPAASWLEANRTLAYLGAFVAAVALARLFPQRWPALVGAIALAAVLLSAYALLVKVFPVTLNRTDVIARLRAPFGYWNAVGLAAAVGLPACLWVGSRRERGALWRGLTPAAITLLVSTILLSYSRSALLAAIVGAAAWFALVPERLRGVLVLAMGVVGAAPISAWALSTSPLTRDGTSLASRTSAGHAFGLVLLLVLALMAVAGLLAAFLGDRIGPSAHTRRRIGTALLVAVALVPFAGAAGLAASHRGFTGEIEHFWNGLTNSNQVVGDAPGRLVKLGSTRSRYWSDALKIGRHSPLGGAGAGTFGVARGRYTTDYGIVGHAHGYLAETFADLGLLGICISVALLLAWAAAAARTLRSSGAALAAGAMSRSASQVPRRAEVAAEQAGLLTLLCVVIVFGVHSAIDWTWFLPGTAVPALLCAGWLVGRAPLTQSVGLQADRRPLLARPGAMATIIAVALLSILAAWATWQPLSASNSDSAALAALGRGDVRTALSDARAAASSNPLAVEPLWALSTVFGAIGDPHQARAELVAATRRQPHNAASWRALGLYDLNQHDASAALSSLQLALRLDRGSYQTLQAIVQAQSQLRAGQSS